MKNVLLSSAAGALALVLGIICHRLAPGLGLVLMPMFWPIAVLAVLVPLRHVLVTAALVPMISCLLSGMPAYPLMVSVKFAVLAVAVAFVVRRLAARLRK